MGQVSYELRGGYRIGAKLGGVSSLLVNTMRLP